MIHIIMFIVGGLPFVVADAPLWLTLIGGIVVCAIPVLGSIVGTGAWIWALVVQLGRPFSVWTIVVIVLFLFSIISMWYPELSMLFRKNK